MIGRYGRDMKDDIKKSIQFSMIAIDILFITYTIIIFILKETIPSLILPINASFFMLLTFFTIMMLGFQKSKRNRAKIKTTNAILIITTLYM